MQRARVANRLPFRNKRLKNFDLSKKNHLKAKFSAGRLAWLGDAGSPVKKTNLRFRSPLIHHCLEPTTLPTTTTFNLINRSHIGLRRGEFGELSEYRCPAGSYPEKYMH